MGVILWELRGQQEGRIDRRHRVTGQVTDGSHDAERVIKASASASASPSAAGVAKFAAAS